jgi:hypothetical protein
VSRNLPAERALTWVDLVEGYDPGAAIAKIEGGAIDEFLDHRAKHAVDFDDERKLRYLRHLAATGRKQESALVAGIVQETARKHGKEDPDGFGAAVDRAVEFFREVVIDRAAHKFAVEGWEEPIFYKGEQVGGVWKFCPRTFELYAKRMHPEYRERVQADVNVTGGILVIPASAASLDDWQNEAKAVEAEHEVVDD